MELEVQIAALEEERFHAQLDFISPKGEDNQGTIQFQIRAVVDVPDVYSLRAGYSANADIVLSKSESVLAVQEKSILMINNKSFVEVKTGNNQYEKREVELGLSDGIMVEVHHNPGEAICDKDQAMHPDMFVAMMKKLRTLDSHMNELWHENKNGSSSPLVNCFDRITG